MRTLGLGVLLCVLAACSGSGGDPIPLDEQPPTGGNNNPPPGPPPPPPPPPPTPREKALTILGTCGASALQEFLGAIDTFENIFATGQLPPTTVGMPNGNKVPFWIDLDSDGTDDLQGELAIEDKDGNPVTVTIADFLAGLDQFFLTRPDGTRLISSFRMLQGPALEGTLTFVMKGGAAETVEGDGTITMGSCKVDLGFDPVALTSLEGDFPTVVLDVRITATQGVLAGTATLDGTPLVVLALRLDGGSLMTFHLDLQTGQVTSA
jgi:hypothetical protein